MKKGWRIGDISFATKEEYRAGKRDLEQIKKLLSGVDLDDPFEVKELYRMLKGRPFLFESEVGTAFKAYLQDRSFGSGKQTEMLKYAGYQETKKGLRERDIMTERKISRSYFADYEYEKIAELESAEVSRRERKYRSEEEAPIQPVRRIKRKKEGKKTGRKRLALVLGLMTGISLMLFALWQIFSYDILSYISKKKMEEIISCVLIPYNATVSDAHRIADLIASGLYTEDEAVRLVQEEEQMATEGEPSVLYQYSMLYERNSDMAGWIRLDGTVLNYPVMLTPEEEEYYLKRDFDKGSDINGLPFMDARCTVDAPVSNYLIHGHNMKNGSMFSCLLNYEDPEFYEEHKRIHFDTIYESGVYEIVGVFQTRVAYADEDIYRYYSFINAKTLEEYEEYIAYVKEHSFYETGVKAEFGEQLITLSTCDRRITDGRFVVVAKKCQ